LIGHQEQCARIPFHLIAEILSSFLASLPQDMGMYPDQLRKKLLQSKNSVQATCFLTSAHATDLSLQFWTTYWKQSNRGHLIFTSKAMLSPSATCSEFAKARIEED
jgi:hypothetical protein